MVITESTIVCLDNSEYMSSTDISPTRLAAQQEAAKFYISSKLCEHLQNDVGLLELAQAEIVISLTTDEKIILSKLFNLKVSTNIQFLASVRKAHAALKNRPLQKSKIKILVFVGSPIEDIGHDLIPEAKLLRRENLCVDIISFGEIDINEEILKDFMCNLNGNGSNFPNRLITVEGGFTLMDAVKLSLSKNVTNLSHIFSDDDIELARALEMSLMDVRHQGFSDFDDDTDSFCNDDIALVQRMSLQRDRSTDSNAGSMIFLEYSLHSFDAGPSKDEADEEKQDEARALDDKKKDKKKDNKK